MLVTALWLMPMMVESCATSGPPLKPPNGPSRMPMELRVTEKVLVGMQSGHGMAPIWKRKPQMRAFWMGTITQKRRMCVV